MNRLNCHAQSQPDALAVVFDEDSLTYSELNCRANRLAHYLTDIGVTRDSPVAICLTRSVEMIVAIVAIVKAGGYYIPLDPNVPAKRLSHIIQQSDSHYVLSEEHLITQIPDLQKMQIIPLDGQTFDKKLSKYPEQKPRP